MALPFTPDELNKAIADGDVTERPHPTLPLYIYNYSPSVQYENKWNNVTRACRGLILDEGGNVVARPWEKFFNLGQVNLPIQFNDPVEVMDKMDGSLGIMYPTTSYERLGSSDMYSPTPGWAIATRGSFASTQAIEATKILHDNYRQDFANFNAVNKYNKMTFLFEIIFPANRIVLDYGKTRDLVLLGAVENERGFYHGPRTAAAILGWNGPVVDVMPYKTISEANGHLERANAEGFVIRSHNFMVKLKQPDYVELHRLVTNASPKTVWEQLKAGKSKSEIVSAFPDEFHDYIGSMIEPQLVAFDKRLSEVLYNYNRALENVAILEGVDTPRANYARVFKRSKDSAYFFKLLDGRPIRDMVWAELRPRAEEKNDGQEDDG